MPVEVTHIPPHEPESGFNHFLTQLQREEEQAIQNVVRELWNPSQANAGSLKIAQWLRECTQDERDNFIHEKTLDVRKRYK